MARLQQEYVGMVEEKILSLEVVDGKAVRVLGDGDNNDENAAKSADNNDDDERGAVKKRPAVIPTTEELAAYVHQPSKYQKIQRIQQDCIQRAEEKVAIADQTYSLVDNVCKRLDSDLADLEKLLQVRKRIYQRHIADKFLFFVLSSDFSFSSLIETLKENKT